jgi:TolA-binding protein
MKNLKAGIVGVLLIVGLAAWAAWQQQTLNKLREENTALRTQAQEVERLRADNERLGKSQVGAEEMTRIQAERAELLRLRGEIGPLRQEKGRLEQLAKDNQQLREMITAARQQAAVAVGAAVPAPALPPGATPNLPLPGGPPTAPNQCQANLRMIEGAMQQWALEHKKTANDVPTWNDLVGPTGYLRAMPVCPAGGVYSLGPVSKHPTCTTAGHVIVP